MKIPSGGSWLVIRSICMRLRGFDYVAQRVQQWRTLKILQISRSQVCVDHLVHTESHAELSFSSHVHGTHDKPAAKSCLSRIPPSRVFLSSGLQPLLGPISCRRCFLISVRIKFKTTACIASITLSLIGLKPHRSYSR